MQFPKSIKESTLSIKESTLESELADRDYGLPAFLCGYGVKAVLSENL